MPASLWLAGDDGDGHAAGSHHVALDHRGSATRYPVCGRSGRRSPGPVPGSPGLNDASASRPRPACRLPTARSPVVRDCRCRGMSTPADRVLPRPSHRPAADVTDGGRPRHVAGCRRLDRAFEHHHDAPAPRGHAVQPTTVAAARRDGRGRVRLTDGHGFRCGTGAAAAVVIVYFLRANTRNEK